MRTSNGGHREARTSSWWLFAAADASHEQGSNGARPLTSFWASNSGVASGGGAAGTPQPRSFSKH